MFGRNDSATIACGVSLCLGLLLTIAGCQAPANRDNLRVEGSYSGRTYFWHRYHRETLGLSLSTLSNLRFYPDRRIVLVSSETDYQGEARSGRLIDKKIDRLREIVIPEGAAGVVDYAGPNSIRLYFGEMRFPLVFSTASLGSLSRGGGPVDSVYFLSPIGDNKFLYDGDEYTIVEGSDAALQVDVEFTENIDLVRKDLYRSGGATEERLASRD